MHIHCTSGKHGEGLFCPTDCFFVQNKVQLDENAGRWMKGGIMRSFDYSRLYEKAWDTDILNLIAKIHECKGRQDLFIRQKPVELDRLVEIAKIQSTEASNKIEGIVTTSTRMKQLFEEGLIIREGSGRSTFYVRSDSK